VLLEATEIDCGREADAAKGMRENLMIDEKFKSSQEDAAARAQRLAVLIRVRIKEQMAQSAGSQALYYWLCADGQKPS